MNVVLSAHENILNQCGVGKKGTVFKLYSYSVYLSCLIEVNVGLIRGKCCTMYSMIEDIYSPFKDSDHRIIFFSVFL